MEEMISSLGFPIVATVALAFFLKGIAVYIKDIITVIVNQFVSTNEKLFETNKSHVDDVINRVDVMDDKLDILIADIKERGVN